MNNNYYLLCNNENHVLLDRLCAAMDVADFVLLFKYQHMLLFQFPSTSGMLLFAFRSTELFSETSGRTESKPNYTL